MTVRVVFADDHPMYQFGLRAALDASTEVEVVDEAADGAELLALVARCAPDVVLTDLSMPKLSGTAAIGLCQGSWTGPRVDQAALVAVA